MPGPCFRRGDGVALHVVSEDDHEFVQRNLNHPAVRPGFGAATPLTADDAEGYVSTFAEDDDKEIFLVCADGETATGDDDEATGNIDPVPVGEAFLFDLHEQRGSVELGYWIAPEYQGNGYATEAARLLVGYAIEQRRLHKVNARVLAFNDGSHRVLEKVGFEPEGCRREEFFVDGEHVDADLYGLTADEWRGGD
jgi:RimJ/RimL family protein N-acetyltransferase